jgi:hypothetical protein
MDDLDRLYRRLIHNIRASRPEYLQIPFTVQELYEQLIPYRHNRRDLAIETNQDYEAAVSRLLAGERGYVRTDPGMQEALLRELNSPTGDPGIFKEYAQAQLSLGPIVEQMTTPVPPPATPYSPAQHPSEPISAQAPAPIPAPVAGTTPRAATEAAFDAMAPATTVPSAAPPPAPTASILSSLSNVPVPTGCRFCGGTLPEGRDVHYCPHCGENLRTRRCPACGAEIDTNWAFCVTCGRRAG